MCVDFSKLTIKTQACVVLTATMVSAFGIVALCGGIMSGRIQTVMVESGELALTDQIKTNAQETIKNNGTIFSGILNTRTKNMLNSYYYSLDHIVRADGYSIGFTPVYWDHEVSDLAHPLSDDPRYPTRQVSLRAPTTFIPGQLESGSNIDTLYQENKVYVDQSAKMAPYFPVPFEIGTDVVAVYFGQDDAGVFTQFPGVSSLETDPARTYDPRRRPWYGDAVELGPETAFVTLPYEDFSGKGWMITISKPLYVGGKLVGVAGLDMLIDEIRSSISDIKFKDSGIAHLLTGDGTVIASPQWEPARGDSLITYSDLTNPSFTSEDWANFRREDGSRIIGNYQVNSHRINDGAYIILSVVHLDEIRAPIVAIQDVIEADVEALKSELVTVTIVAFFLVYFVIGIIVYPIIRQTQNIIKAATVIQNNTGKSNIFEGVKSVGSSTFLAGAELRDVQAQLQGVIVRGHAAAAAQAPAQSYNLSALGLDQAVIPADLLDVNSLAYGNTIAVPGYGAQAVAITV